MALMNMKPTSPGRRGMVRVVTPELYKGPPEKSLLENKSKSGGRNNHGRITTRHRGGGSRQHYRMVDFKRNKDGVPAKVERLEYDPNRTAHLALLCYEDGERRYLDPPDLPLLVRERKRDEADHVDDPDEDHQRCDVREPAADRLRRQPLLGDLQFSRDD